MHTGLYYQLISFVHTEMHPKVKLDDGAVVTIIDLPARNGMLARVMGRVTRRYMIELFETGEKILVERSQIRKNAMHHLNNMKN